MPKLSNEAITNTLSNIGLNWVDNEYKNLDSLLTCKCVNCESEVIVSIKKARKLTKENSCNTCQELDNLKENDKIMESIAAKPEGSIRVMGIDGATRITGYSIFQDKELVTYGIMEIKNDCPIHRTERMRQKITQLIKIYDIDYVYIENVYISINKQTAILLAKLLGVLENQVFRTIGKPTLITASEWKAFCGIKGKNRSQQKRGAQDFVKKVFDVVATQDSVDAICVGWYGCHQASIQKNHNTVGWEQE